MTSKINNLRAALFATNDGRVACDLVNALSKHSQKGSDEAKDVLADYVRNGSINHMRQQACASLAEATNETEVELTELFRRGLSDPNTRYWSILGYINAAGRGAYEQLTKIAGDKDISLEDRTHAVKCLARFSKQPFDRNLPSDPGYWKETDLRLSEVHAWAKDGYPDGYGYSLPNRHPALDEPKTSFEKIVSRLDRKLAKKRRKQQDLAAPTAWLTVAAFDDIQRITARWNFPSVYLDFLMRFSPLNVTLESREYYNHFQLLGASELLEAQDGYSFNPITQQIIPDWPAHLVVIASHGGDPFVLDLSKSDGQDAPVDTAQHGAGVWEFHRVADSFSDFLKTLAK